MYKKRKVYISRDEKLRAEIIQLYHNMPVKGHGKQWKIVELITRNFWWPGVIKEVKQYIKEYDTYQCNKNCTEQLVGKLMPNSIPEKPQAHISADFITKLLLVQGYNVWKLYGLSKSIILGRGPQFMVEIMQKLNRMLGIESKLSTAFHLQIDEQIERVN